MSNFKQGVIYFLLPKLLVIYPPPPSSYHALSKNIGKNSTTNDRFVVTATYECIESTDLRCSVVKRLGLHFIRHLLEVR
jgi:hypothetical protein